MMRGMMGQGMMGGAEGNAPAGPQSLPPVSSSRVVIRSFAFAPPNIKVAPGVTVTWTNEDDVPHTMTSSTGNELNSPLLSGGEQFSHTFSTPGTYAYLCNPHPWMTGLVTVG